MRMVPVVGLLCTLLAFGSASGSPEILSGGEFHPASLPVIEVLSSDDSGLRLRFDLPALEVSELVEGTESFQAVTIPGGALIGEPGQPAIPVFTRLVMVPEGAEVRVESRAERVEEISGTTLAPLQPDEGAPFTIDRASYERTGYDDAPLAAAGGMARMRGLRLVPITFRPVAYDAANRTLRVTESISVDLTFAGGSQGSLWTAVRGGIPSSFDRMYRDVVVNYPDVLDQDLVSENGTWLLISQNDPGVLQRLQPLIEWRKRKGLPVVAVTTQQTGSTANDIKAFIQSAYSTWEVPPEYIVLAGDGSGSYSIPTFNENISGYYGEGDHPYTQLEGGDVLPEAHVGRLSFSSYAELETIVAKIVGYESQPDLSDPTWFQRACLVGDPSHSGPSCVQLQQWAKVRLRQIGYTQIDTIFSGNFVSQMSTALNRGDTVFSYRGYYGMSNWGNNNTYALTNGWKMPFVVTITCDTGSFANGTSRSEGFLRAGSATSPKGGIGAIGTATIGTHTRFNNCIHYGILYGLLYNKNYEIGAALTRGKLELWMNYQTVDPNRVVIWSHWNNLMGDPAVDCFTGYPYPLEVEHDDSIPVGANSFIVNVSEHGLPEEGARVCLYKGVETFAVGLTDSQGRVELPIGGPSTGNMLLTVTKHDRYPYLATVPVAGQQRYVSFAASEIDDDVAGESSGNDDGLLSPGESIELRVQLRNYGILTAPGVTASLSCDDPYVTLDDDAETFGDIPGGNSAWSADDFGLTVSHACPNGRVVRLSLDVASGGDLWHSLIDLPVAAPDLVSDNTVTLYGAGGNGRLDPGESVGLSVLLTNEGNVTAVTPAATILSMSEFLTIQDATGSYPTIPGGSSGENTADTFTITAAPETYPGYQAHLKLVVESSGGMRDTTYVTIPVGIRATTDPVGPDEYGYYAFDNTDVSYPEAPAYGWIELDPAYGGSGAVEVPLPDMGDGQDKSLTVDIPFAFQYYGKPYTRATICSNGWIAMGSTYLAEYRNWTIPGAGGPENLIAVFWDDLYQSGGSKVLQRYDAAEHRWIVEWSRLRNAYNNQTEVVEAIFYDPAYVTTETGDGVIVLQYHTVSNPDPVDGYCTVGIENADHSDGLLYTFFGQYPPGAATLTANRAIRFVPTREVVSGTIEGTVTNQTAGGAPLSAATVTVLENGHEYLTGGNGAYLASESPGTYTLTASRNGFEPDTVSAVAVLAGGAVEVDFSLRDIAPPSIHASQVPTTSDSIGPYVVDVQIYDASPLALATLYYRINGGSFVAVELSNLGGTFYRGQIPGQSWSTKVEYYVVAADAGENSATDPADAPESLYLFYVAPTLSVLAEDMEVESPGWSNAAPGDDAIGGRWVRVDPNGTYHGPDPVQPEDDHTSDPGVFAWVTGNAAPGLPEASADVDAGRTTLTTPRIFLDVDGIVILRYWRWFSNDTGTGPGDDEWVVQVSNDDGQSWIDLERTTQSDRSWRFFEFDLSQYIGFSDAVRVRFVASDTGEPSIVEAAVDDVEVLFTGIQLATVGENQDFRFGLEQNRPNPFNPRTTIRFSLEKPTPATLVIFDVQGRARRHLVDESLAAGAHSYVWDGRDDAGNPLPSGIYLYKLDSEGNRATRKMILVE